MTPTAETSRGSARAPDLARQGEAKPIPAPAQPQVRGHLPALDGVRGLAILVVLLLHFVGNAVPTTAFERAVSWVTNYGSYGVDLFFVLSGFLITGILYDSREKAGYFRNFYMRRLLRIFPLYYGTLAVMFLVLPSVPALRGTALDELRERQAWVWLYGVNVYDALRGDWALPYIDHFWSLAVEEHFYFVWPLVVWLLARRPAALLAVSLAAGLGAMAARVIASMAGVNETAIYVLTPFRLDGLALGGFLAVLARQPGGVAAIMRWLPRVATGAGAMLLASFAWNRMTEAGVGFLRPTRAALILVLLACLLLWVLTARPETLVARVFRSKPMVFLGVYSYGLYVYHHFLSFYFTTHRTEFVVAGWVGSHTLAVALQAAVGIAASVAVAYASYHLYEKRFLALKERWSSQPARVPEARVPDAQGSPGPHAAPTLRVAP